MFPRHHGIAAPAKGMNFRQALFAAAVEGMIQIPPVIAAPAEGMFGENMAFPAAAKAAKSVHRPFAASACPHAPKLGILRRRRSSL